MAFLSSLTFSLLACNVFQLVGATLCTTDGLVNDACNEMEEGNLFLQISQGATRGSKDVKLADEGQTSEAQLLNESSEDSDTIKPFDCMRFPTPIQVLKDPKGFSFKQLNVETGEYQAVFSVPFKTVFPAYKDLNACGINPVDDIPYCAAWSSSGKTFIVKLAKDTMKFVAQIPAPASGKAYTTGTFSPDGTFYIADSKGSFYVIDNIATYKTVSSERKPNMAKWMKMVLQKPKGFTAAHDAVVVNADLDGKGKKSYMMVLNKGVLQISALVDGAFTDSWIIPYKYAKKGKSMANGKGTDKWGAGWSFSGKVFFAINSGDGVYEIELPKLDLTKYKKSPGKNTAQFALKRSGDSQPSGFNDGANCMNTGNPWLTKVLPMNCAKHGAPLQILRQDWMGYLVKKLDIPSGVYSDVFPLQFTKTNPPFKFLNAVGINPMDTIAYGCLSFGKFPTEFWIVRFDGTKIEFVVKVTGKWDPVAGTFDSVGNYYLVFNNEYSHNPTMVRIEGLDTTVGYADSKAKELKTMKSSEVEAGKLNLWNFFHFSDIVAVKVPLESKKATEYVVSVNREKQAMAVEWDATNASNSKIFKFTTNNPFGKKQIYQNFGAAWTYANRVFFANNDGEGVVEVEGVDMAKETMTLKKVGKSAPIVNNDGFNCWDIANPWPPAIGK